MELNIPVIEIPWERDDKFAELTLSKRKKKSLLNNEGQCTFLYKHHVLFIKWFEFLEVLCFHKAYIIE